MIDTNETISGRKERRQQTAVRLLATLAAAEVVALAVLVVVLMVSLVHAWDLETWTLDAVAVTAAVILAAILGYVCYRFAIVAYRRRFQFSLRGLLGATAVLSLLLGTLGQQVLRYHHLHRVLDTGASFRYGPAQESRHPLKRGWIESRLGYDPFGRITSANLRTDQALLNMARHVESFSDLESLVLSSPCITDAGLADADGIARLPRLRSLNLIVCTGVTDSGLESLSRWSQVEVLLINSIPGITDDGLGYLAPMTQLRDVWFVAEGGAKLSLSDAGLIHLSQLPRLESVVLVGVGISDAGLSHLGRLQHLKQVLLIRTAVTEDGFKRLQGTLPDCKVIWRPK